MTRRRRELGRAGEDLAARWYRARGYRLVDRNWRCRAGELDLVVVKGGTVVFCEVKTRSSHAFGSPAEAVTLDKQRRVRRLGVAWIRERDARPRRIRFDVASVVAGEIEVIHDAF